VPADGRVERVLAFTVVHDRIVVIDIVTDPDRLAALDIELV
jgi:RNA polymerase sigma-70 factor (ECF subfamily)